MAVFKTKRNRDAYATIRGYKYQIDLTIVRWLELEGQETLELERGEDIDRINRTFISGDENSRTLEQVKHLISPITLKSPACMMALANALDHRITNPNLRLRFRFTTNAESTFERPCPFKPRQHGIDVWEALRTRVVQNPENVLDGVRQILRASQCPHEFPPETWKQFRIFVDNCTDLDLQNFISDFEWGSGAAGAENLEKNIVSMLLEMGHADWATRIYKVLFLSVIKCLCRPGLKLLDRKQLDEHLAHAQTSGVDLELMRLLELRVFNLENRVETIENIVQKQGDKIVEVLNIQQGIDARLDQQLPPLELDTPQIVKHAATRSKTVAALIKLIENLTWLALFGGVGTGKSELTKLIVATGYTQKVIFIPFRDQAADVVELKLLQFMRECAMAPMGMNRGHTIQLAAKNLTPNTLIIWDDLPRLIPGSGLSRLLIDWCRACRLAGHRLVTTSYYQPSTNILAQLPDPQRQSCLVPAFTNEEATELFRMAGMPDGAVELHVLGMLNQAVSGHPVLLTAIASGLSVRGWKVDPPLLKRLIPLNAAAQVDEDILPRLLETVADTNDRRLLYRLALIQGEFGQDILLRVAKAHMELDRPRERLSRLAGPWVQQQRTNSYVASPLIRPLVPTELTSAEKRDVLNTLAEEIVLRRVWTVLDVGKAVSYCVLAESFERAGALLLAAFNNSKDLPRDQLRLLLAISWHREPLPEQISRGSRIFLRGLQIRASERIGEPCQLLFAESDGLIASATERDAYAVVAFVVNTLFVRSKADFSKALQDIQLAVKVFPKAITGDGTNRAPVDINAAMLLWIVVSDIRSALDLEQWLDALEILGVDAFPAELWKQGDAFAPCSLAMNAVWMHEHEKPESARDWKSIERALKHAVDVGFRLKFEPLVGPAARSQIVVLADYLKSLEAAEHFAEEILSNIHGPEAALLITEGIGKQCFFQKKHGAALRWLRQAVSITTTALIHIQADARLFLSSVVADENPSEALLLAEEAAALISTNSDKIGPFVKLAVLSELALARSFAKDYRGSYLAYDDAATELLANRDDSPDWKSMAVLFGHLGGYLTHVAKGEEPSVTSEGEPYARPYRTMFLTAFSQDRVSWFSEDRIALMPSLLCSLAEAVGEDDRAADWAIRGIDEARRRGNMAAVAGLARQLAPFLIKQGKFVEALDTIIESAEAGMVARIVHDRGQEILTAIYDSTAVLNSASAEQKIFVDQMAASTGGVSIACGLARLYLDEPDKISKQASAISARCRETATDSADALVWQHLATSIDAGFVQRLPMKELNSLANEAARIGQRPAHLVGYLAMSLAENAPLQVAAVTQAIVMHGVESILGSNSSLYRGTVIPFISEFWTRAIRFQRFAFSTPDLVQAELIGAINSPTSSRVRAVLKVVLRGVGGRLPTNANETLQWLDEK